MSILSIVVLGLLGIINAAEVAVAPPQGGKFFYSDLRSSWIYGMHYIDVLIGSPQKHFQLALSSSE